MDFKDTFSEHPAMSVDESLEYWKEIILNGNTKCSHKNLSVIFTNGTLEYQSDHSNIELEEMYGNTVRSLQNFLLVNH